MASRDQRLSTTSAQSEAYTRQWYTKMLQIWRDRIDLMGIVRTGALRSSISGAGLRAEKYDIQATYRFLLYGLYVDAGTGNGYRKGNGGNLRILDKGYRREHSLGSRRTRRPWYSRSWYISREVLKNKLSQLIGEEFVGAFDMLKK